MFYPIITNITFANPIAMTPTDGAYDELQEEVEAIVNTSSLTYGNHTIYVRGIDIAENIGIPTYTTFFMDTTTPEIEVISPTEGQTLA